MLNVLVQRVLTGVVLSDRLVNSQSTVREALPFSAKLRQPESDLMAEKEAYIVDKCLKMFAIVGSLGVEHKKRRIRLIMAFLCELADNVQAILCTIHQPSAEMFQVFDRLRLLRKGRQTIYFGDIREECSTLLEYFERNGDPHCGPAANP
ncbi:hypothetical protein BDN67DRAFT_992090 [Paxillus ammoniavirescens]|nr:hypothetical protein BDN67DRAFT_992090 [Paxillus ammoniavirescens]